MEDLVGMADFIFGDGNTEGKTRKRSRLLILETVPLPCYIEPDRLIRT
jgi:hypothetical protein